MMRIAVGYRSNPFHRFDMIVFGVLPSPFDETVVDVADFDQFESGEQFLDVVHVNVHVRDAFLRTIQSHSGTCIDYRQLAPLNDQVSLEHNVRNTVPFGTSTRPISEITFLIPWESVWLMDRYAKTWSNDPSLYGRVCMFPTSHSM